MSYELLYDEELYMIPRVAANLAKGEAVTLLIEREGQEITLDLQDTEIRWENIRLVQFGKQGRLQITVYNKTDEFQEVKENIETKKSANVQKKSLIDFYREIPDGNEGSDLGMYYLSYLDDACKKVNVKFESLVNQFSMSDLTVVNLIFNF